MKITLGLTDEDMKDLFHIMAMIKCCCEGKTFSEEMPEKEKNEYHDWKGMENVITRICNVIDNQYEIDKTATGMIHVAVCKKCSLLSDQEIRDVRKMVKEPQECRVEGGI